MRFPSISAIFLGAAALVCAQPQPPAPVALTPPAPSTPSTRVATVFGQNAIANTREGQKASAELSAKYAPKSEEFKRKQTELNSLREQLRKGQASMSADAWRNLNQTIENRTRDLQRLGEDSQNALEQDEGAMLQQIGDKLQTVIQDYASRNGIAVVIDVSLPNGPVKWASPSIDITNEIVKLYDQKYPVAAEPPAASPTRK